MIPEIEKWNFPDNELNHNYLKCIMTKMGLFDEVKGFIAEHMIEQMGQGLDRADTIKKVEMCAVKREAGEDVARWAYRGTICGKTNHLVFTKRV